MDNERIERIKEMERIYDEAIKAVDDFGEAFDKYLDARELFIKLADYYEADWREDFEADEEGKLPPDLKRGVLSEDGLYDLFTENDFNLSYITLPDPPDDENE